MVRALFEHPRTLRGDTEHVLCTLARCPNPCSWGGSRILPPLLSTHWGIWPQRKKSEPRHPMQLTENNYFYYLSQLKSHFWVRWHSPKILCLALTVVQLSQPSELVPCRGTSAGEWAEDWVYSSFCTGDPFLIRGERNSSSQPLPRLVK